jgi:hypothetical protein
MPFLRAVPARSTNPSETRQTIAITPGAKQLLPSFHHPSKPLQPVVSKYADNRGAKPSGSAKRLPNRSTAASGRALSLKVRAAGSGLAGPRTMGRGLAAEAGQRARRQASTVPEPRRVKQKTHFFLLTSCAAVGLACCQTKPDSVLSQDSEPTTTTHNESHALPRSTRHSIAVFIHRPAPVESSG